MTEDHFKKAVHFPVQSTAILHRTGSHGKNRDVRKPFVCRPIRKQAVPCENREPYPLGHTGLEPVNLTTDKLKGLQNPGNSSDALSGALSGNSSPNVDDLTRMLSGLDSQSKAKLVELLTKTKPSSPDLPELPRHETT